MGIFGGDDLNAVPNSIEKRRLVALKRSTGVLIQQRLPRVIHLLEFMTKKIPFIALTIEKFHEELDELKDIKVAKASLRREKAVLKASMAKLEEMVDGLKKMIKDSNL